MPRLSHMDLAACLEDPQRAQALICWNINIAASNPEQARLRQALAREDLFTVVLDLFPTDTTDFADFVLPAASFLEFDDLVAGYFHLTCRPKSRPWSRWARRCPIRRSSVASPEPWATRARAVRE